MTSDIIEILVLFHLIDYYLLYWFISYIMFDF